MEAAFERSLAFQVEDVGIHLLRLKRPLEKATPHAAFGEPARRDGSQRRQPSVMRAWPSSRNLDDDADDHTGTDMAHRRRRITRRAGG